MPRSWYTSFGAPSMACCTALAIGLLSASSTNAVADANCSSHLCTLAKAEVTRRGTSLTDVEWTLIRESELGGMIDGGEVPTRTGGTCVAIPCDESRSLRAWLIEWLCTDRSASALVSHRGITILNTCIRGELDLQYADIPFPLHVIHSRVQNDSTLADIMLFGARVPELHLDGTCCANLDGSLLWIDGDLQLVSGFEAHGHVLLDGAKIGRSASFKGGRFFGDGRCAINAQGLSVGSSVLLESLPDGSRFWAKGTVDFTNAVIPGYFVLRNVDRPDDMALILRSVHVGTLEDALPSWPRDADLIGFEYARHAWVDKIANMTPDKSDFLEKGDLQARLDWIKERTSKRFDPEQYVQLARVFRESGFEEEATEVLIAKEKARACSPNLNLAARVWYATLAPMIGYGYRPWGALRAVLVFVVMGCVLFGIGRRAGIVVPTRSDALIQRDVGEQRLALGYPRFNALIYSADTFIPLIRLDQADHWTPSINGTQESVHTRWPLWVYARLLRSYLWIHVVAGWTFSTLIALGLAGLVRR